MTIPTKEPLSMGILMLFHVLENVPMCGGHNLPTLHFEPLGKNIMGTTLTFKINTTISYLLLISLLAI